jgi:dsRNA-specific ribonuclease
MDDRNIAHDDDIITVNSELVFNPYNISNQEISLKDIQTILTTYGLPPTVNHFELYRRAFVHQSYCTRSFLEGQHKIEMVECPPNCLELYSKSNERLEFLGDGVLECVTKYYLYRRFSNENEGFMTEKKIALVKNEAIGKLAYDMGLHKWYILSKHAEEKKIRTNLKKLGCLFEAFIGALFLDFNNVQIHDDARWFDTLFVTGPGFQMAQLFIERIFERYIDWTALITQDDNYKNILQVKIQKEFKTTPEYIELNHGEFYHMGVYLCLGQPKWNLDVTKAYPFSHFGSFEEIHKYVKLNESVLILLGEGKHKIKKKSEQMACEHALKLI